jgi:serine/threonine protein kinase
VSFSVGPRCKHLGSHRFDSKASSCTVVRFVTESSHPLTDFSSPSECHLPRLYAPSTLTHMSKHPSHRCSNAPSSEVFSHTAFPAAWSHYPGASQCIQCVAPTGFLTLSTPYSPCDLPGLVSSQIRSLGYPFKALLLALVPRALSSRRTSLTLSVHDFHVHASSSRPLTQCESRPPRLVIHLPYRRIPSWACAPPGFLVLRRALNLCH